MNWDAAGTLILVAVVVGSTFLARAFLEFWSWWFRK